MIAFSSGVPLTLIVRRLRPSAVAMVNALPVEKPTRGGLRREKLEPDV